MNTKLKAKLAGEVASAGKNLQQIVDSPFKFIEIVMLDLGVVVLLLENTKSKSIDRVALSKTEPAAGAVRASKKPFHEIKIPMSVKRNAIVKAITTNKKQLITDWKYLFVPVLTPQEARDNQNGAGIMCSVVSPLKNGKKRGAIIFSFLCPPSSLSDEHYSFIDVFSEIVAESI